MSMTIAELRAQSRGERRARRSHPVVARDADGVEHRFKSAQDAVDKGFARNREQVYLVANKREYVARDGTVRRRLMLHNGYQWRYEADTEPWPPYPSQGRQYYAGKDHKHSRAVIATFENGKRRTFGSLREAARAMNVHHTALFYAIKRDNYHKATKATWAYADTEG